jgi:cysteine synthase
MRLRQLVPPRSATIEVKLEWENHTGSLKDRMAQWVIAQTGA